MSRALERGPPGRMAPVARHLAELAAVTVSDRAGYWCLVRFGLLLGLAGTGWVLTSAALITLVAPVPILQPLDFPAPRCWRRHRTVVRHLARSGWRARRPIFASSVVAMPLLLDKRVTLWRAVLASWDTGAGQPGDDGAVGRCCCC